MEKNNPEKPSFGNKLYDNIQNIGIAMAMLMGISSRNPAGNEQEKRIPDWMLSMIPEEFSIEDEIWKNLIKSSCDIPGAMESERAFREMASKDPDCFDMGKYRKMLMEMRKEYLEQSRKPVIKNEGNTRLVFDPITFRDPCNTFFSELLEEQNRGGSVEEIYERQKKIAIDSDLLIRMNTPKKIGRWILRNKLKTLALIITVPIIFICLSLSIIFSII